MPTHFSQHSVLEAERLLYRHEGLEKLLAAHEEKFIQLQRMTEVRAGGGEAGCTEKRHEGCWLGQLVNLQVRAH